MKKRILKVIVAVVVAATLAVLCMPVSLAEDYYWYFDPSTDTLTISGTGQVGQGWKYEYGGEELVTQIKKVVINEGLTEINSYTFRGYTNLESVELPGSLEYVGRSAFEGCTSLTSIEIPDNGVKIDYYAFEGCTALSSIVLPDSAELNASLRDTALYGNPEFCENNAIYIDNKLIETDYDKIKGEFIVREGTHTIGPGAFVDCHELEKVILPDSVTSIGEYAFADCYALTQINIPSGVTSIPKSAFSSCDKLSEIVIPEGITKIESSAFYSEFIASRIVNMPNSVTEIDEYAFDCAVDEVNYAGSKQEWESIAIAQNGNENLLNAKINFNSYDEGEASNDKKNPSVIPVIIAVAAVAVVVISAAGVVLVIMKKKKL